MDYGQRKGDYDKLYNTMKIKANWKSPIYRRANQIVSNRDKYMEISDLTGVPWYFIGLIHERESGLNFTRHLHNGDPLSARTRQVPAGRPIKGKPPFTFVQSAVDALVQKGFDKVTDWSIDHMGFMLEKYNGFGYYNRGVNNPYLWSGSQHYTKGKYIKDHKFSANDVDQQMGVMPLLFAIREIAEDTTDYNKVVAKSRRLTFTERFGNFFKFAGVSSILSWSTLESVRDFATDHAAWILLGVGVTVWLAWTYIEYRNKQEVKEGRYKPSRKAK